MSKQTAKPDITNNAKQLTSVRMDKWLWAARFFKTRPLAVKACELGRVSLNNQPAKPAREVRVGDKLQVKTEGGDFGIEVLALHDVRGPASLAQTLYAESDASRDMRRKVMEERKVMLQFEVLPLGRPDKRARRSISKVRGRG